MAKVIEPTYTVEYEFSGYDEYVEAIETRNTFDRAACDDAYSRESTRLGYCRHKAVNRKERRLIEQFEQNRLRQESYRRSFYELLGGYETTPSNFAD